MRLATYTIQYQVSLHFVPCLLNLTLIIHDFVVRRIKSAKFKRQCRPHIPTKYPSNSINFALAAWFARISNMGPYFLSNNKRRIYCFHILNQRYADAVSRRKFGVVFQIVKMGERRGTAATRPTTKPYPTIIPFEI